MKKLILLLGSLSILTIGFVSTSCSNDDDEWQGCMCRFTEQDGFSGTDRLTASEMRSYGFNSCAELQAYMLRDPWTVNVNCTNL